MGAVTVILPAHNPDAERLRRTLAALADQTEPHALREVLLIDNASTHPLPAQFERSPPGLRVLREATLGLTAARRRGLAEATGDLVVFVDDDNVLAPDYLAQVVRIFSAHPRLGALGGRIMPEFEIAPPAWSHEFFPLLALRDLGSDVLVARGAERYPAAAPVGAGMAVRRAAVQSWMNESGTPALSDRRGQALSSGGDNDLVFSLLRDGWDVGYFPELVLTHLIPASRLDVGYLARLNRGIQRSWMQVLSRHRANPWPTVAPWTVPLRQAKAWFTHRAWSSPAARIRWQGACGHFEGRVPHLGA
jgi:glycosyltransferase involved in cell wall biosynthesis